MKEKKKYLYLDSKEISLILLCLINLRNKMISENRYPDCVNDIIERIINAPNKKV